MISSFLCTQSANFVIFASPAMNDIPRKWPLRHPMAYSLVLACMLPAVCQAATAPELAEVEYFERLGLQLTEMAKKYLARPREKLTKEIKQAYLGKAKELHPDQRRGAENNEKKQWEEAFKHMEQAYCFLKNPDNLAHYMDSYNSYPEDGDEKTTFFKKYKAQQQAANQKLNMDNLAWNLFTPDSQGRTLLWGLYDTLDENISGGNVQKNASHSHLSAVLWQISHTISWLEGLEDLQKVGFLLPMIRLMAYWIGLPTLLHMKHEGDTLFLRALKDQDLPLANRLLALDCLDPHKGDKDPRLFQTVQQFVSTISAAASSSASGDVPRIKQPTRRGDQRKPFLPFFWPGRAPKEPTDPRGKFVVHLLEKTHFSEAQLDTLAGMKGMSSDWIAQGKTLRSHRIWRSRRNSFLLLLPFIIAGGLHYLRNKRLYQKKRAQASSPASRPGMALPWWRTRYTSLPGGGYVKSFLEGAAIFCQIVTMTALGIGVLVVLLVCRQSPSALLRGFWYAAVAAAVTGALCHSMRMAAQLYQADHVSMVPDNITLALEKKELIEGRLMAGLVPVLLSVGMAAGSFLWLPKDLAYRRLLQACAMACAVGAGLFYSLIYQAAWVPRLRTAEKEVERLYSDLWWDNVRLVRS